MIHIEDEIFLKKKFDFDKLKSFDFSIVDNKYMCYSQNKAQILSIFQNQISSLKRFHPQYVSY